MLNPLDRPDPSLYPITRQIAFSHSLSEEEAGRKWSETAAAIREKLSSGSSVELRGLGYLNLNEKGRISFTASDEFLPLYEPVPGGNAPAAAETTPPETTPPETTPAETAVAENTPADASSPVAAAEEIEAGTVGGPAVRIFEDTGSKPRRARWWIAGSIVVLLLTGWFTYRGTLLRKKKASTIRHIIHKENKTKGLASIDSMKLQQQDFDTAAGSPLAMAGHPDDSVHYVIVFAIYNSRDRAEHQYGKMRGWGHPVVLIRRDSSLYELGLPFTSLPADTADNLKKMKTLYGERVHIEYRPASP